MRAFPIVTLSTLLVLSGCGGGGSGNTETATGRFIDSIVQGLAYSSGGQAGITDSSGSFTYEIGEAVTFSVGAIELGTVSGGEIITPVDLVSGDTGTVAVQNIARFLIMLDSDGDSSNGISISAQVRGAAENWQQPDFTTSDLDTALAQIISDVSVADSRVAVLPTAGQAQDHLEATLACLSSGIYAGTFSGEDIGSLLLWIQHQRFEPGTGILSGATSGLAFSTDDNLVLGVAPQEGLSFDSQKQFVSGTVSSGAEFSGQLNDYRTITNGDWQNGLTSESGTFSGERKAGGEGAVYRLSGFFILTGVGFSADGSGLIGLDIAADNSVSGVMVTLRGDETALAGTFNGSDITVSGGGNSFTLDFDEDGTDPSNDLALSTVSGFTGQWVGNSGNGEVIGTSCQPG